MLSMKSSEFHRLVRENGWRLIRAKGSHYIYEKNGRRCPVAYHGSEEMGKGIERKIRKQMGLK